MDLSLLVIDRAHWRIAWKYSPREGSPDPLGHNTGGAFTNRPKRQELTYFLNLSTFQKYLILSNAWNVTVTSIPLIGIMLSFSCNWENILFAVSALTGSTLYLWNLGMAQYIFSSTITMTIYQLTILIPLFFYACFMPFLLIILMVINIVFYLFIKNDSKSIWN